MDDSSSPAPSLHLGTIQSLSLHAIYTSPHQMRRQFDDASLSHLAQSMKQEGLIQPITVRPVGNAYELVAGERRLRAAELLGWETILARVIEVNDEDAAFKGLIENLQRTNLNPLEEARGFKQLIEPPYNLTQETIAERVGKSQGTVARCLALLELPVEIQELIPAGQVTESHTRVLRKITDIVQQIAMARQIHQEGLSVKETERLVREWLKQAGQLEGRTGNDRRKSASRRLADGKKVDPLEDLWPQLSFSPNGGPPGSWNVRYEGKGQWTFEVQTEGKDPKATLGDFFIRLGNALNDQKPGDSLG
ncbi:MAG: ParB/RepB/Spo0J family partition protein [Elusimicrobiota bacterium]|jgi:ParB family chromosome partitioning protein